MTYLSRVWMAASVAVVQGRHITGGDRGMKISFDLFVAAGMLLPVAGVGIGQAIDGGDESIRKAMYISCWGPS